MNDDTTQPEDEQQEGAALRADEPGAYDVGAASPETTSVEAIDSTSHADDVAPAAADDDAQVAARAPDASADGGSDRDKALLPADQNDRFRARWDEIQTAFVDEPQHAVEQADALVADLTQRVAASLTKERERLEGQWAAGDEVSTEDLRVALTRYRTFFDRLLTA